MPAKAKVTKAMIVEAAFAVARETGAENINISDEPEKGIKRCNARNRDELYPLCN